MDKIKTLYDQLDTNIAMLYGLTSEEYHIVKSSLDGENLFLI